MRRLAGFLLSSGKRPWKMENYYQRRKVNGQYRNPKGEMQHVHLLTPP